MKNRLFFNEFPFKPGWKRRKPVTGQKKPGIYSTSLNSGEITEWMYDSFDDSMYMNELPHMKYHQL